MALIEVNTYYLKNGLNSRLNSIEHSLNSARQAAGSLLIPADFKYCNYLLYDLYNVINNHLNTYYDLKNWLDRSIDLFDKIDDEIQQKASSLSTVSINKNTNEIII